MVCMKGSKALWEAVQVDRIYWIGRSSLLRKIIPIRETVAGEAKERSEVSKIKLTFEPKEIRSPVGKVRR